MPYLIYAVTPRLDRRVHLQWPVRDKNHPGTPVLHTGKFSRGLGRFVAGEHMPPAELPDQDYPLMLTTGRVLYHWHGAEMTRRARGLTAAYPEALIEINPKDAQRAGIAEGDMIQLASRRGEIAAKASLTERVVTGLCHLPFPGVD
jgi:formate dehydrogenase major subunit/formate dehydrogenase alpha subunit